MAPSFESWTWTVQLYRPARSPATDRPADIDPARQERYPDEHCRILEKEQPNATAPDVAKGQREAGGSDCCSEPVHRRAGVTAGAC